MLARLARCAFVALLAAGFIASGFVHAIVPHSHTDTHGHESAVWVQMHSALRHEDKKLILNTTALPLVIFAIVVGVLISRARRHTVRDVRNPYRERYLIRGIAPYRVFG